MFKSAVKWAWVHPVAAVLVSSALQVGAYALDKYGGRWGEVLAAILHPFVWAFTAGCAGTAAVRITRDLLFGAATALDPLVGLIPFVGQPAAGRVAGGMIRQGLGWWGRLFAF